jgi:hypothetical protein
VTEEEVFLAALDLPDAATRAAYLDRICGGDTRFRRQVETLLDGHFRSGESLNVLAAEQVKTGSSNDDTVNIQQPNGETLDHRADLFSLGSVRYAMCTGRPPFRAKSTLAVLKRVVEDTPRPIAARKSEGAQTRDPDRRAAEYALFIGDTAGVAAVDHFDRPTGRTSRTLFNGETGLR